MKSYTMHPVFFLLLVGFVAFGCDKNTPSRSDTFAAAPVRSPIQRGIIDEASGLADSRTISGYLWTHNDSGNPSELFLLSHDGMDIRKYPLPSIGNRDWEDMAVGPGPADGVSYVYVGDIGNNNGNPDVREVVIYRMPELKSLDASFDPNAIDRITYSYPDGPRDAEALMVDPKTKDIFIVSKEFEGATLYRLPYPQSNTSIAERIGKVPSVVLATGGDIAADGHEIIIRTYANIYYWRRRKGETVSEVLVRAPSKTLPYELEPQGEAVAFGSDMKGYYTLSEVRDGLDVTLNYFERK